VDPPESVSTTLFTLGAFVRQTGQLLPERKTCLRTARTHSGGSSATLNQQRKLTNAGLRTRDVSYVKGIHNIKSQALPFMHTFLTEISTSELPDPVFNAVCLDASAIRTPVQLHESCAVRHGANPGFSADCCCTFDLTAEERLFAFAVARTSKSWRFTSRTDHEGNWAFNLGLRADLYRGIVTMATAASRWHCYNIKRTSTVLRLPTRESGDPLQ